MNRETDRRRPETKVSFSNSKLVETGNQKVVVDGLKKRERGPVSLVIIVEVE